MSSMPTPILLFGDDFIAKDKLATWKRKCSDSEIVELSATTTELSHIRMKAGLVSWDEKETVLIIKDLPNRKQVREFILDLVSNDIEGTKIIVWDSTHHIKWDKKSQGFGKTWSSFVSDFRKIDGAKVMNCGEELDPSDVKDSAQYVEKLFASKGLTIDSPTAKVFVDIVGRKRGLLKTDVEKLSICAPNPVTLEYVIENAFPTTPEAVIQRIYNVLNTFSYEKILNETEQLIDSNVNENVIGDIIVKQARWQMAAAHFWFVGSSWGKIPSQMMEMGNFPSCVWHNIRKDSKTKKSETAEYKTPETIRDFCLTKYKFPQRCLKKLGPKSKVVRGEKIAWAAVAQKMVEAIRTNVVLPNKEGLNDTELRNKVLQRSTSIYLFMQDKLAEIRYGKNPQQDLQEMIRVFSNTDLSRF